MRKIYAASYSMTADTLRACLNHKLIRRPATGEHELYDMKNDPMERKNLYGDPALKEIQDTLERRLLDWFIQTSDATPFDENSRGMPPHSKYWRRLIN